MGPAFRCAPTWSSSGFALGLGPRFLVWKRNQSKNTPSLLPSFIFTLLYYLPYGKSNKDALYNKNRACILYDNYLSSKLNKSKFPSFVGRTFSLPLLINKYINIIYRYSFFGGVGGRSVKAILYVIEIDYYKFLN